MGGSNFANDSERIGPEVPVVICPGPFPGHAVRLTGEARHQQIHASTPRSPVKTFDVVPDGSIVEQSVPLPLLDDFLTVFVPLDVADGCGIKSGQPEAEGKAAVSAEQIEDSITGTYIHMAFLINHRTTANRELFVGFSGLSSGPLTYGWMYRGLWLLEPG